MFDVEDRPDLAHQPADRREEQFGSVVEVPVDGAVRHAGTLGHRFDGRFLTGLGREGDHRVEDGVAVAIPSGRSTVGDLRGVHSRQS